MGRIRFRDSSVVPGAVLALSLSACGSQTVGVLEESPSVEPPDSRASAEMATGFGQSEQVGPVTKAVGGAVPVAGGSLLVTPDGRTAVVTDAERDRISVVDLETGAVTGEYGLQRGSEPGRVALSDDDRVHVVLRGSGEVATFSPGDAQVNLRAVCSEPRGIGFSATQGRVLVACRDGQLMSLTGDGDAERLATLPDDLRDVVVVQGVAPEPERIYVTRFRGAELLELGSDFSVAATSSPPAREVPTLLSPAEQEAPPDGLVPPDPLKPVPFVPGVAWRAVATPKGVLIAHERTRDEPVAVGPESPAYGSPGCGLITTSVTHVLANGGTESIDGIRVATAVDTAMSSTGQIAVIDNAWNGDPNFDPLGAVQVFDAPGGEAMPQAGCFSFPALSLGLEYRAQPVALAFNPGKPSELLVQVREPALLVVFEDLSNASRAHAISLGGESVEDTGHDIFTRGTGSGLACATCHPEGGDDGRTWNFRDVGARRTQTLGAGTTGALHWNGEFAGIEALIFEVLARRMGGSEQSEPRAAALGQWLTELRPLVPPDGPSAASEEGRALFESEAVGCATCHGSPNQGLRRSDSSFDVGTGLSLQVPSLAGVAYRSPLMHDGCAANLRARFEPGCGGGDAHGVTSTLSEAQIDALIAYLRTL